MSAPDTPAPTRRAMLARAATAAFGATLAGSLAAEPGSAQTTTAQHASAPASTDASSIAALRQVEQAVVVAYRTALASGRVDAKLARRLRGPYAEQRTHVRMLSRQLALLQPGAFVSPPSIAAARQLFASHHFTASLFSIRAERDVLELLAGAEGVAIGASFKAMSQLTSASLLRAIAEMMASDAQHAAVLGELLYPTDITRAGPDPCVEGTA